jgi:hypothetical protein
MCNFTSCFMTTIHNTKYASRSLKCYKVKVIGTGKGEDAPTPNHHVMQCSRDVEVKPPHASSPRLPTLFP